MRIGKNEKSDPLEPMFYHFQAISLARPDDWQTYGIFSKEDEAIAYAQQQIKNQLIMEGSESIQFLPMKIIQETLLQEAVDRLKPSLDFAPYTTRKCSFLRKLVRHWRC